MKNRFYVDKIDSSAAVDVWNSSPHATVFTLPPVLTRLVPHVDWWLCSKGHEALCIWPIPLALDGSICHVPFSNWIGPFWSASGVATPAHRWLAESTRVYELFISRLLASYGAIEASLAPGLDDIRVFEWWNYSIPQEPHFRIRPRYTAVLEGLSPDYDFLEGFRKVRRYELRRSEKYMFGIEETFATEREVAHLYVDTMLRQDKPVSEDTLVAITNLVRLVEDGFGEVTAFRDSCTQELLTAVLVLYGRDRANLVISVTHRRWRSTGLLPRTIVASIQKSARQGCSVFDFNGANSPRRGDDKHSYGARHCLYFDISYRPAGAQCL